MMVQSSRSLPFTACLNFTVHCKSNYGDLGVHVVPYHGFYAFHVLHPFEPAPHICDFQWKNITGRSFIIYESSRDWLACGNYCPWSIKQNLLCLITSGSGATKEDCYAWGS